VLKKYIYDKTKWLSVEWNVVSRRQSKLSVVLLVSWKTHPESMGTVVAHLTQAKAKIKTLVVVSQAHKITKAQIEIGVRDKDHLLDVLDAIHRCECVESVYQMKDQ